MPLTPPINTGSGQATVGTTVTGTWTNPTTAGNLLVAFVFTKTFGVPSTPSGWRSADSKSNGSTDSAAMFYQYNAASQTSQAFGVPSGGGTVLLAEYPGFGTTDPLDKVGASASFGSSASATASGTTQANELWVLGVGIQGNNPTVGTPSNSFVKEVTDLSSGGNISAVLADYSASATGNATSSVSITSNNWIAIMATFKASTSSAPPFSAMIQSSDLLAGLASGGMSG